MGYQIIVRSEFVDEHVSSGGSFECVVSTAAAATTHLRINEQTHTGINTIQTCLDHVHLWQRTDAQPEEAVPNASLLSSSSTAVMLAVGQARKDLSLHCLSTFCYRYQLRNLTDNIGQLINYKHTYIHIYVQLPFSISKVSHIFYSKCYRNHVLFLEGF